MKQKQLLTLISIVLATPGGVATAADRKPMPDDAKVYIIWPADGQVIPGGKFWVRMGLSNAGVAPADLRQRHLCRCTSEKIAAECVWITTKCVLLQRWLRIIVRRVSWKLHFSRIGIRGSTIKPSES